MPAERQVPSDRPGDEPNGEGQAPVFRSWGEVFDLSAFAVRFRNDAALANMTTAITCWGSGHTNLSRASDTVIKTVADSVLSPAESKSLLNRYKENPNLSVGILAQTQVENEQKREQLLNVLSASSDTYSLWIDASTPGRRSMREFTVMEQDAEGVVSYVSFAH